MARLHLLKIEMRGFTLHFLMPIIAIVGVAIVGTVLIHASRAASSPYSGTCTGTVISTSTKVTTTKYKDCILQSQELMDAIEREDYKSYRTAVKVVPDTFVSGSEHYLTMNGVYSTATAYAVKALPGNGSKNELTNGTSGTWQTLCTDAAAAGLATGGKAATYVLSINTKVTGEYSKYTNADNFKSTCGTTTSGGTGGSSTTAGATPLGGASYAGAVVFSETGSQLTSWNDTSSFCTGQSWEVPNGTVTTDSSGDAILKVAGTSGSCVSIHSPSIYSSDVIEADIDFPALPSKTSTIADWTSFWMDGISWPEDGELDAVEAEPINGIDAAAWHSGTSTAEFTASTDGFYSTKLPKDTSPLTPGWHVVDIVYTKGFMAVYYDGKEFTSYKSTNVTGDPMSVILSTSMAPNTSAVQSAIGGAPVNSSTSATSLTIKYLKIWAYK